LKLIGKLINVALNGLEFIQYAGLGTAQGLLKTIVSEEAEYDQSDEQGLYPDLIKDKASFAPVVAYDEICDPGQIIIQKW
jgi:hypothetical protein